LSLLREMTVIAHQKQIEELRESFRQKLLLAESRPGKVTNFFKCRQYISQDPLFISAVLIYMCRLYPVVLEILFVCYC